MLPPGRRVRAVTRSADLEVYCERRLSVNYGRIPGGQPTDGVGVRAAVQSFRWRTVFGSIFPGRCARRLLTFVGDPFPGTAMATRVKPAAEVVHQEKIGPVAAAAEKTPVPGGCSRSTPCAASTCSGSSAGRHRAGRGRAVATPLPAWLSYHLNHPDWIGFSAWDLIMPLFLFIVGAAMPFSFAKRIEAGQTAGQIYTKVLLRTALLFVLGMVAQGRLLELDLDRLRIFSNTLQAIAAGYLIASILMLHLPIAVQVLATAALLAGYWGVLRYVPVPGQAAGTLEPQMNIGDLC